MIEHVIHPPRRATLPERYRFHLDNGYSVPPGRHVCAWQAAETEQRAARAGYTGHVVRDEGGTMAQTGPGESWEWFPAYGVILIDPDGEPTSESLWGIATENDRPDDPYMRMVLADLAAEHYAEG